MDSVELAKDPSEGTAPSVSFETPLQVSEAETKVLREGDGEDLVLQRILAAHVAVLDVGQGFPVHAAVDRRDHARGRVSRS